MKKIVFSSVLLFFFLSTSYSQEEIVTTSNDHNIPRFRIGIKIGAPNIVGGNIEYLTPLFGNRIAPYIDFSTFNLDIDQAELSFNYLEVGSIIYFNAKGKGLYTSLSYGSFNSDVLAQDAITFEGETFTGTAEGDISIQTFNVKLGAKLGRKLYFRTEIGYGIGNIPSEVLVVGNVNGITGEGVIEIPNIPGITDTGLLLANIGIGYSF